MPRFVMTVRSRHLDGEGRAGEIPACARLIDGEWRFDPSKAQAHLGKRLRLLAELQVVAAAVNMAYTG